MATLGEKTLIDLSKLDYEEKWSASKARFGIVILYLVIGIINLKNVKELLSLFIENSRFFTDDLIINILFIILSVFAGIGSIILAFCSFMSVIHRKSYKVYRLELNSSNYVLVSTYYHIVSRNSSYIFFIRNEDLDLYRGNILKTWRRK